MDGHGAEDLKQSTADMTVFESAKSSSADVDEMGSRIDKLKQSINDLKAEMGMDSSSSPSVPSKFNEPESK